MAFHFRRSLHVNASQSSATFGPHETRTTTGVPGSGVRYTERTPIRQGRTKTGGLLDAVIYVGLLVAAIALFA